MSIVKLAASTAEEFGRRLLKGSPHLSGSAMGTLQGVHRNASDAIKERAAGHFADAASNLANTKDFSGYAKTSINSNLAKVKETMGNKFKTTSVSVAP